MMYDHGDQQEEAVRLGKKEFDYMFTCINVISDDLYKDVCLELSLLRDNIIYWSE